MSRTVNPHLEANIPTTRPDIDRRGFSEEETAHYLGISRASLRQGRMEGRRANRLPTPPYVKLGRKILYLKDDLDRWLEENRHTA